MGKKQYLVLAAALMALFSCGLLLASCAGQRQGVVCDEIEYRYNSMSYSPDQRAFMEEELRACREEEAKKSRARPRRAAAFMNGLLLRIRHQKFIRHLILQ